MKYFVVRFEDGEASVPPLSIYKEASRQFYKNEIKAGKVVAEVDVDVNDPDWIKKLWIEYAF